MSKVWGKVGMCLLVAGIFIMPIQALQKETVNIYEKNDREALSFSSFNDGWVKHFEGTSWGHAVIQTRDNGYIVAGGTNFGNGGDALLLKTNAEGEEVWRQTFGSFQYDGFEGVCETPDGGFVASGWRGSRGFLVKTDVNGNILWEKAYRGAHGGSFVDVQLTQDNGFAVVGWEYGNNTDYWLMKTDSEGNELWSQRFGGEFREMGHAVHQTTDGGFILTGWIVYPNGTGSDGWVVKTDYQGVKEWEKIFDGGGSSDGDIGDFFHYGKQTTDGGYIFTGATHVIIPRDMGQVWLVKTDSEGNEVWNKTYGIPFFFCEWGFWVDETTDGGYILTAPFLGIGAYTNLEEHGQLIPEWSKFWLIKTDANGNMEWNKRYGNGISRSVQQIQEGGYISTGHRGSYLNPEGILLIKTNIQ